MNDMKQMPIKAFWLFYEVDSSEYYKMYNTHMTY